MAKIINFNKARKAHKKTTARARADENAVKFGRTKEQKKLEKEAENKARRELDGKVFDKGDTNE